MDATTGPKLFFLAGIWATQGGGVGWSCERDYIDGAAGVFVSKRKTGFIFFLLSYHISFKGLMNDTVDRYVDT
jgi:hypothetical protein